MHVHYNCHKNDIICSYRPERNNVFSFLLKTAVQVSCWMSAGTAFHTDGPGNENTLSPNFIWRYGTSFGPLSVDRRCHIDLLEAGSTMSARYIGDLPLCMECISKHSLYSICQWMGSQCSWIRLGVMWSDVWRPKMSRTAAFWTCCSGWIVDSSIDTSTELQ